MLVDESNSSNKEYLLMNGSSLALPLLRVMKSAESLSFCKSMVLGIMLIELSVCIDIKGFDGVYMFLNGGLFGG